MTRALRTAPVLLLLAGCGSSTGIVPVGPDTYAVSEMRSPALGGGPAAQRAVLAESVEFCRRQGRVTQPLTLRPDGDRFTPYYPTAFDATFRCLAPPAAASPASPPTTTPTAPEAAPRA